MIFGALAAHGATDVLAVRDAPTGLEAFVCIHDTKRGPAAGGTRCRAYPDEGAMLREGLRLAAAMTRKYALAGRFAGGGKIVVRDQGAGWDRAAAFRVLGRAVAGLGGRVFTGPDLGVSKADLAAMRETCPFVDPPEAETWDGTATARTILAGMQAAAEVALGRPALRGLRVVVQGAGLIGGSVLRACADAGMSCVAADPDPAALARVRASVPGLEVVAPDACLTTPCDILSPCALGDVVSPALVPALRCRAIVPGANCVLTDHAVSGLLHARGICYVPDYLANAGAALAWEGPAGPPGSTPESRLSAVLPRAREILREAAARGVPPLAVCEARVAAALRPAR